MRRTIDQCVEDVLPVLLDQVVDVTKDSAGIAVSRVLQSAVCGVVARRREAADGGADCLGDLPHGENSRGEIGRSPLTAGEGYRGV